MKKTLSTRALFILGFLVIAAANMIVITHVAYNRLSAYETIIDLTQRELSLSYGRHDENSGLSLRLQWRILGKNDDGYASNYHYGPPGWLDEGKLKALGFKVDPAEAVLGRHKYSIPRQAFIVLEYQGSPYQEALIRAGKKFVLAQNAANSNPDNKKLREDFKRAEKQLEYEQTTASRLFAIDAGLDPDMLRKKYDDRSRFIIAPGIVTQTWNDENKKAIPRGYISRLCVENIHVPLEFRKIFDEIASKNKSRPLYAAQIAYGGLFEPWIRSVRPADSLIQ